MTDPQLHLSLFEYLLPRLVSQYTHNLRKFLALFLALSSATSTGEMAQSPREKFEGMYDTAHRARWGSILDLHTAVLEA